MCLLVPPAGRGQELQGCQGQQIAPQECCPQSQMRTAAGVSVLRDREGDGGEKNGGGRQGINKQLEKNMKRDG